MPTLLAINNYHYRRDGGCALYLDHNRLFENIGWNVVPFSMVHPDNLSTPWSKYFVTEIEFGRPYSLREKLVRIPNVIYSLDSRRKLGRLLDSVPVHIAHCHCLYHHLSPSILSLLKQRGIPTIMTLHDFKPVCPAYHMFHRGSICERCKGGRLHNVVIRSCIKDSVGLSALVMAEAFFHRLLRTYERHVDRFVVPSRFYREKLVEWGWDARRIMHIPNFVDLASLRPDYSAGKGILYFGRLSPEKGLMTLVRAAAMADVPVVQVAGTGPQEPLLREAAEKAGARIEFLGYLAGTPLHEAVRSARATVVPSECFENAPMSLLESYALGKPVIGAAIGGIPELIREGETGWLFESGSAEDLAEVLRQVARARDSRVTEMGRAARTFVACEFESSRYLEHVGRLYAGLGVAMPIGRSG